LRTGSRLATFPKLQPGGGKGKVKVTTTESPGHSDEVLTLALSDDGRYLASAGKDHRVCMWDAEKVEWVRGFGGHRDTISVRLQSHPMSPRSGSYGWHSRGRDIDGQTPGVTYQVLVPNEKGLETALCLLAAHPDKPPVDEIAVFTAAIDASSLLNTNATVADPLKRLERVVRVRWTRASGLAGPSASSLRVRTAAMRITGACGT